MLRRKTVAAWSSFAEELCEAAQPADTNKFLKFTLVLCPAIKIKVEFCSPPEHIHKAQTAID